MKQKLIILITLLSVSLSSRAQEYRVTKSSGQLKLNVTGIIVEGYDGKDIIFSGEKVEREETDERAKGLVPISSSKYIDNTGLGISVIENGQDVNVNLVTKKPIGTLTIKVPNNIKVSIVNNSNINGVFYTYASAGINYSANNSSNSNTNTNVNKANDEIVLKNLKSEIEVSVYSSKIKLENNSGPMSIKTVSGSVDAIFSGEIKGPVSIISATNYVDVTLPASTKANIEMGTTYGKLYAGKEFKIDFDKVENDRVASVVASDINTIGIASRNADRQKITADTRGALSAQSKDRSVARTTKTRDTAAVKGLLATLNGRSVGGDLVYVTGNGKLTGGTQALNTTTVNGIQIAGEGVSSTFPSYTLNALFSGGDKIKGKLNGGGVDLIFKSTNKNVYLRQQ